MDPLKENLSFLGSQQFSESMWIKKWNPSYNVTHSWAVLDHLAETPVIPGYSWAHCVLTPVPCHARAATRSDSLSLWGKQLNLVSKLTSEEPPAGRSFQVLPDWHRNCL